MKQLAFLFILSTPSSNVLHKFQATLYGWISLLSPFSVLHLPYDILEDGVRDYI